MKNKYIKGTHISEQNLERF